MLDFDKDCKIFRVNKDLSFDNINSHNFSIFESYDISNINHNIIKINYSWVDQLKLQDKIVSREKKNIVLFYLKLTNVLFCFGNSESSITFAIKNIEKLAGFEANEINIFNQLKEMFKSQRNTFMELISISFVKEPSVFDKSEIIKIDFEEISEDQLVELITKKEVTSFLFYSQKSYSYFYVDNSSVICFDDSTKQEDVIDIICDVARYINVQ